MKQPLAIVVMMAGLASCSSSGPNEVTAAVLGELRASETAEASAPDVAKTITRAQVDRLGLAMLRVEETLIEKTGLLVAVRGDEGRITYSARGDRRLVLEGGLIQSTYGYGYNLEPVETVEMDPIANPRPIGDWPATVERHYMLDSTGLGTAVRFDCVFQTGSSKPHEILDRRVDVVVVAETCEAGGTRFENRHLVEADTGYIWSSAQWTGPDQGTLIYEVLEPLD